ncbi:MerR family transcriptional regulator [Actinomycetospora sp. NBRC 106378]|uniref:MerR family transcriptional regulator n=1 Tax=Actinomycetospora sp. NBRC 106378 TaxID=3032208 RepID=UPI0024A448FF|nr:MerR family transcriptional regulator [Actinomycetospora sp. NBRC 106378]GLZ50397.1 MerR family transcriptional regulator [Actinomycetospora sp. NBRC 106378]
MTALLSIGEFATVTHLSVKTLRHYHDAGVLLPRRIDPSSGYRYYAVEQIPTAQVIRRFRDLDMPVAEIARLLGASVEERAALIAEHLVRLERRLATTSAAVGTLQRLLAPDPPRLQVERRWVPATTVTAVSGAVARDDVLDWYADAMAEIDGAVDAAGVTVTGPVGGRYDNELFTAGHGTMTVFAPTSGPVRSGRVAPLELPARDLALTVHHGPHADIDVTYGALGRHLAEHALVVDGPVHETYVVGPRDTDDETAWRTEIGWPVFRIA